MMRQVILKGRSGSEGELRYLPNGTPVLNFSLAVSEYKKTPPDAPKEQVTHWFDIVVWGDTAVNTKSTLKKGSEVLIVGKLQSRSWEDKTTKKKVYKVDVVADTISVMQSFQSSEGSVRAAGIGVVKRGGQEPPPFGDDEFYGSSGA